MQEFLESLGWRFIGWCGCVPKKRIFANQQYPQHQVWIGTDRMEIRKRTNGADHKLMGIGGKSNYQTTYEFWINK